MLQISREIKALESIKKKSQLIELRDSSLFLRSINVEIRLNGIKNIIEFLQKYEILFIKVFNAIETREQSLKEMSQILPINDLYFRSLMEQNIKQSQIQYNFQQVAKQYCNLKYEDSHMYLKEQISATIQIQNN